MKEDISAPHLSVPQSGRLCRLVYKPASNCYHLTPIWILANKHRKCCCRQFQPERIFLGASDELEHQETAKLCALYDNWTGSGTELKKVHIFLYYKTVEYGQKEAADHQTDRQLLLFASYPWL